MRSVVIDEHHSICDLIDGLENVEFEIEQIKNAFDDVLNSVDDAELTDQLCDAITAAAESAHQRSWRLLECFRRTITRLQLSIGRN